MAQSMRPISQVTATGGAPTSNVHLNLDGTAPDSGNYFAGDDNATGVCEVLLTDLSGSVPSTGTCTVIIYQAQCDTNVAPSSGGAAPTFNLEVYEGATQRASVSGVTPTESTFTIYNTLTFNSSVITDWSNVRVRFTSNGTGGTPSGRRGAAVSYVEISTPNAGAATVTKTYTGTGSVAFARQVSRFRSFSMSGTGASVFGTAIKPRVWLNTTQTKSGATQMTVTSWSADGTSITFTDPSGAPTGSLYLGVERVSDGALGWIAVEVTASGNTKTVTFTGTGSVTFSRQVSRYRAFTYAGTGTSVFGRVASFLRAFTFSGTGAAVLTKGKQFIRAFTFSGTGSTAFSRGLTIARSFTYAATGAPVFSRLAQHVRSLTFTGTGTPAFAKVASFLRAFTFTGTGTSVFSRAAQYVRAFSFSGAGSLVLTKGKIFLRSFSFTGTGSSAFSRIAQHVRAFTYAGTGTVVRQRALSLLKAMSATGTPVLAATTSYLRAFTYAATGVMVGDQTSVQSVSASFTGTGTPSLARSLSFSLALAFSGTGSPAFARAATFLRSFAFSGSGSQGVQKQVGVNRSVAASGSPLMEIGMDATVDANMTGSGSVASQQAPIYQRLLSYTGSAAVSLSRHIGKLFNYLGVGSVTLTGDGITESDGRGILRLLARPLLRIITRTKK